MRTFKSGASRNGNEGKHDVEAFNNPLVDQSFNAFMHKHRQLEDGSLRPGDNWQRGIPLEELNKSLQRHNLDVRLQLRGYKTEEDLVASLNAMKFNINGILLTLLEKKN